MHTNLSTTAVTQDFFLRHLILQNKQDCNIFKSKIQAQNWNDTTGKKTTGIWQPFWTSKTCNCKSLRETKRIWILHVPAISIMDPLTEKRNSATWRGDFGLLPLRAILFRIGCSMWHVTAFPQMKLKLTVNSSQLLSLTMIIWKIKHPNGTSFTASAISPVHVLVLPKGTHTSIYRFIPISETYKPTYRVFWLNLPTSYELPWTTKVNSCQSQQTPTFLCWTRVDLRLMQSQKPELQGKGKLKGRQSDESSKKDMWHVY